MQQDIKDTGTEVSRDVNIDQIMEHVIYIMPLMHKKLLRTNLDGVPGDFSRAHLAMLGILSHRSISVTRLAHLLSVPKSQMTALVDGLVEMGAVERKPDERDRRVINLYLTERGRDLLISVREKVHESVRHRLQVLSHEELGEMCGALKTLRTIADRLSQQ